MLRALVVALLLANLAFFAWTQGWLDSMVGVRAIGDREPERLERQVQPERVRILPPGSAKAAAPAVAPVALACLEAGPFSDAELATAQAAMRASWPAGGWLSVKADKPGTWMVYMGPFADREALIRKEDEIKRRNLAYEELRDGAAFPAGLSLGRFDDRARADAALEQFNQLGVRTARVIESRPASRSHWLRVEQADAANAARLTALRVDALGRGFGACAVTPGG
ncbi:MAG: SPOR domain-containing protein [Burkholderiaceae bacterium]